LPFIESLAIITFGEVVAAVVEGVKGIGKCRVPKLFMEKEFPESAVGEFCCCWLTEAVKGVCCVKLFDVSMEFCC